MRTHHRTSRTTSRTTTSIAALALTGLLAACGSGGSDEGTASESTGSATTPEAAATTEAASLTMTDPWVKSAESGMTAAFGTLVNQGDSDITIVSAEATDITDAMELHETVQNDDGGMAMQPKDGGFTIPAGGDHELAPGGDHLMIMNLLRPVEPGETVTMTLTFDDGSTADVEATVKEFTGADEKYQDGEDEGMDMGDDSGMDMGSDDGSSEDD